MYIVGAKVGFAFLACFLTTFFVDTSEFSPQKSPILYYIVFLLKMFSGLNSDDEEAQEKTRLAVAPVRLRWQISYTSQLIYNEVRTHERIVLQQKSRSHTR
jgi:hypothetical protein